MKVTSIEMNAKDMKKPEKTAEKIMEALGIGGGTADPADFMLDALINRSGLNTVLKMEIVIDKQGLRLNAGGSRIACETMCECYDGFEELLEETKQKVKEVSEFFTEGMDELKLRKEEKESDNGNDL